MHAQLALQHMEPPTALHFNGHDFRSPARSKGPFEEDALLILYDSGPELVQNLGLSQGPLPFFSQQPPWPPDFHGQRKLELSFREGQHLPTSH